ncbi:molybdopterin converting factor subunit 1 [Fredinandcohnia quinoae]|uniref:Molybdopterin synthase sulfur carrier subunit n=1 Tax=Fredinandcohnia quinoae TaxID=2918902 RepID=A0AAW5EAT1_9BACI|nr:molybdopterin converting factor subunit 1 [Fredinandcohnia sp. SECRCQ15]MCH1625869.1 molybdopterin converting factor subunit 1 [Fredinandcohnia sp. SECRCQ15]
MITVLFFAHLQEVVGSEKITLDLESMSVTELKTELEKRYEFKNLNQIMFAINEEYAIDIDVIKAGDTVALIPPVSGG